MAQGDIVQDKSGAATSGTTVGVTFDQTATDGNLLVAMVSTGADGITTPGDWSIGRTHGSANDQWAGLYYKESDGSETALTVTCAGSEEHTLSFVEFEGPWQASPLDKVNSSDTYGTSVDNIDIGTTGTLSEADEVACAFAWNWNGDGVGLWSIDSGFTELHDLFGGSSQMSYSATKLVSATTALNPNIQFETDDFDLGWSIGIISTFLLETAQHETTSGILNAGGNITTSVTKRTGQIARPASTVTAGDWDTGPTTGQNLHDYASDDSDTTYIEDTTA
jgi:hypothetical protein